MNRLKIQLCQPYTKIISSDSCLLFPSSTLCHKILTKTDIPATHLEILRGIRSLPSGKILISLQIITSTRKVS